MRVHNNIPALQACNLLSANNTPLLKAIQRLSTGMKINSAADDAAGLAISEKINSQIRGEAQAIRNVEDGISMLQTAEGGIRSISEILQRMRELSVQAANDTLTTQDRNFIASEIEQLKGQIDNISSSTKFNNICLLDGSTAARWSASDLLTKTYIRGSLTKTDSSGAKTKFEGNYKIHLTVTPGKAEVVKSNIFTVKHEGITREADITRYVIEGTPTKNAIAGEHAEVPPSLKIIDSTLVRGVGARGDQFATNITKTAETHPTTYKNYLSFGWGNTTLEKFMESGETLVIKSDLASGDIRLSGNEVKNAEGSSAATKFINALTAKLNDSVAAGRGSFSVVGYNYQYSKKPDSFFYTIVSTKADSSMDEKLNFDFDSAPNLSKNGFNYGTYKPDTLYSPDIKLTGFTRTQIEKFLQNEGGKLNIQLTLGGTTQEVTVTREQIISGNELAVYMNEILNRIANKVAAELKLTGDGAGAHFSVDGENLTLIINPGTTYRNMTEPALTARNSIFNLQVMLE